MNRKVIVIGGAGFLGRHLLTQLKKDGHEKIVCADRVDPKLEGIPFQMIDVLNKTSLGIVQRHDLVINCSGQVTQPISQCLLLNSIGIANMIDAVKKVDGHFLQISSVGVYGSKPLALEDDDLNPETPYATLKAVAEYQIMQELPEQSTILRLSNLYGENQGKGLWAYLQQKYLSDKKLEFNNAGDLVRFYFSVEDCAQAVLQILSLDPMPRGVYNLTTQDKYSISQIIQIIENKTGCHFDVQWQAKTPWENIESISSEKIKKVIEFSPKRSVAEFINSRFR